MEEAMRARAWARVRGRAGRAFVRGRAGAGGEGGEREERHEEEHLQGVLGGGGRHC